MLVRFFIVPLLGAFYASGWWAWAVFDKAEHFIIPLTIVGIIYAVLVGLMAVDDYLKS